ncbi:MAG: sigma-70 family RNA polymerase sigma factor, partial [Moorella sp. (in: Bacteria)]|nr:sigma-70 family RNA polymerase sigma factor [Moorella sp. (in: firmicutes)]
DLSERELVQKSKNGDLDAFERLVSLYEKKVFTLVYRYTGNWADAHDLAQETFLKVYQSLPALREDGSFAAWLGQIAANVCRDELRKKRKHPKVSLDEMMSSSGGVPLPALSAGCPESALEQWEMSEAVQEILNSLTDEYRLILVMREIQGMSYDEIAAALDISPGTVKSRLSRARQAFKQKVLARRNFFNLSRV